MRIAFDHQIFALQAFGGISRYFVELARSLSAEHEVSIHAPWHQNEYLGALAPNPKLFVQGKALHGRYAKLARAAMPVSRSLGARNMQRLGAQLVHETYYSAQATHRTLPRVVTVYDMIHELFPADFSRWSSVSADKRKAVARAQHVICISESTQRDLVRLLDVPVEKTSVVHLGFESFSTLSGPPQQSAQKPYLLYVGQRAGYKNFALLLQAFAADAQLRREYEILAFGGGKLCDAERALIASLGLDAAVRHQSGSDAALAAAYKNAALFVYPSAYEGFGLPPLEAMAQDVPVVSSNSSSMPEIIGHAAEFFDPTDPSSLTAAINAVLADPARAATLKQLGRERLAQFSWARCAAETARIYARTVA